MPEPLLPETRDMPPGRHQARRAHLLTEIDRSPARRPFPSRRALFGGLAGAALVAGAAAVALPSGDTPRNPAVAPMSATSVLAKAADAAVAQPPLKPRPGQFLYFESRNRQTEVALRTGGAEPMAVHRKTWLPAGGGKPGLLASVENGKTSRDWLCHNQGRPAGEKVDLSRPPRGCVHPPAYRADLPTDPDRMRSWLYRNSRGGNPPDVQAFVTVGDTIRETYVPPAAMAAMFRAAAKIPGVTVRRNAVDFAGRRGVAVGQTWHGLRNELIFDARSYRLLGERAVVDRDDSFRPGGGSTPEPGGTSTARPSDTPSRPTAPPSPSPSESASPSAGPTPTGSAAPKPYAQYEAGHIIYQQSLLRVAVVDRLGQEPR
ncbi:CU044_5270 family protein [Actinomadura kijaniata]|uniref:CU044_5270 family protein n=1 Tax=Actinomadura kijaniata TaxID=46161 RepID=UPI000833223D|nr:CU044_5270 family protein [Actinomadura kijaniata]